MLSKYLDLFFSFVAKVCFSLRWSLYSILHTCNKNVILSFQVAYTFDAGANACLYLLEEDVPTVVSLVQHFFPPSTNGIDFVTGLPCETVELNQVKF